MEEKKIRFEYVDTAKFIAMFFVILCHAISKGEIRHIAYSFHLPIFFILNGITLKIHENESFGTYLEKKLKSYMIPMFCLGILSIFVEMLMHSWLGRPDEIKYIGTMIINLMEQKRAYPLWFVGALLFADIFFYFVVKLSKNKIYIGAIISFLFLLLAIFCNTYYRYRYVWNIDVALFGVFFVFIGYAFSHKSFSKVKDFLLGNRWISLIFGVILFIVGQIFGEYNYHTYNTHLEMWGMSYDKYYLTIPCAVFSSLGVILISKAITNKLFGEIGKTTLVLLAFHQLFTLPLFDNFIASAWREQIINLDGNDFRYLLYGITTTIFTIVFLVGVYYLIIYSPFAFILNKKIPSFYKEKFEFIKNKLIKNKKEN